MVLHWIIFGLLIVAVPTGLIFYVRWSEKNLINPPTEEQKKRAYSRVVALTLFYWLCDLFYMSCFCNLRECKYIFGGLILIIIFMNLAIVYSNPRVKSKFELFGLVQDFIIGIALTIYLISIIRDDSLKEIVIPIVSAVYGGLITLVGVSLTIKKSDKDKKEEEIKKAKPVFSFSMLQKEPILSDVLEKICVTDVLEDTPYACDVLARLDNSMLSLFEVRKIYHDGKWFDVEGNTVILPGEKCILNFRFSDDVNHIFMEVADSLNNVSYYQLKVLHFNATTSSGKIFHTIRSIKEVSADTIPM